MDKMLSIGLYFISITNIVILTIFKNTQTTTKTKTANNAKKTTTKKTNNNYTNPYNPFHTLNHRCYSLPNNIIKNRINNNTTLIYNM